MTTFETSREISAPPEQVFGAFSNAERLARWWGPAGFTNTFETFEFKPGGHWKFKMHAPNGASHPNESVFVEIASPTKIVIQHRSEPRFLLTVRLAPSKAGTTVTWSQAFENDETAGRLRHIVIPANEQNLNRLSAEVLRARM